MILAVAFLLLALSIILMVFGRRRLAGSLVMLSLVISLGAGTGTLPQFLLDRLTVAFATQAEPEWSASNAIILLGGDSIEIADTALPSALSYGRIVKAAEAYRDCRSASRLCTLIVSGGDPRNKGTTEADLYAVNLAKLGVSPSDIVIENKSRNTFENARLTAEILSDRDYDQSFVVTSGFHMRRSLLFFRHFGIDARPLPAFMLMTDPTLFPNAYNLLVSEIALQEFVGLAQYDVYNFMGWNPPPTAMR